MHKSLLILVLFCLAQICSLENYAPEKGARATVLSKEIAISDALSPAAPETSFRLLLGNWS